MSTRFTRRGLGKLALAAAASRVVAGERTEAEALTAEQTFRALHSFPQGFLWGTATASYQVEGSPRANGRGASIWDTFSHTPGHVAHNDTGDVADDEFHRYKQDIGLLSELGVKTYRFSVSWPRIFATGSGEPNAAGLAYYARLVDELRAAGIEPYCTLYHWDLPQTLEDAGGWRNADTAKRYAEYAGYVSGKLSDRVSHFMTTNEIRTFVELGYQTGTHAPGLKLGRRDVAQIAHHAVLAHGLGVQAIRANAKPGTLVGIAENPTATVPSVNDAANVEAARVAFREENAQYLTVVMEGRYTDRYLAEMGADAPRFTAAEMKAIGSPLDFVGLNIYQPTYTLATNDAKGYMVVQPSATYPRMLSEWLTIGPECLYWAPVHATKLWNLKSIYITENGASAADTMMSGGKVLDIDRVMYLRNYLSQLQKAVAEGAPVKGYFVWSLMDNYEWNDGYGKRFGLFHVDFATQQRTAKLSAEFYKSVVRENRVV